MAIKRADISRLQEEVLTGSYYGGVYLVEMHLMVILADDVDLVVDVAVVAGGHSFIGERLWSVNLLISCVSNQIN